MRDIEKLRAMVVEAQVEAARQLADHVEEIQTILRDTAVIGNADLIDQLAERYRRPRGEILELSPGELYLNFRIAFPSRR